MDKVLVILGPTSSGKSDIAVELAKEFDGEVVSADSRQVYKGLDIGSGKITKEEMKGILHYLLDVSDPSRKFTVAQFQKKGTTAIKKILRNKNLPIICGGTGLYIDSLIYDSPFPKVPPQPKLRTKLEKLSTKELIMKLEGLDPERAATVDRQNRRRLVRALEIVLTTGSHVPKINERKPKYDVLKIGIKLPKEKLKEKIVKRVDGWVEAGLVDEVAALRYPKKGTGVSWKRFDEIGLEYKIVSHYLQGDYDLETMKEKLVQETWRYVKRQMTWFKRDKETIWISDPASPLTSQGGPRKASAVCQDWLAREASPSPARS